MLTAGLALYATLPPNPTAPDIVLRGIVCGLGFGFFQSPNNRELIGSAPREKSTSAAGLLAAMRVGGQTVGAALVAIMFGAFGASVAGVTAPHDVVARAAPAVLWLACGCAAVATLVSAVAAARDQSRRASAGLVRSSSVAFTTSTSGCALRSASMNLDASPTSTIVGARRQRRAGEARDRRGFDGVQRRGRGAERVERQPGERVRRDAAHESADRLDSVRDPAEQRGAPREQLAGIGRRASAQRRDRAQHEVQRFGRLRVLDERAREDGAPVAAR